MYDNIINIQNEANVSADGKHIGGNCKPVICIETGEIYSSVLDAANAAGVSGSVMSNCCRQVTKTCKGKRYCFLGRALESLDPVMQRLREASEYEADAKAYREIKAAEEAVRKEEERKQKEIQKARDVVDLWESRVYDAEMRLNRYKAELNQARVHYAELQEDVQK